ncbi:MAG TPA: hypothetical protein VJ715_13950 [Pyrinomonadaceae bacterium]|nr:hypothetical protein [Pyrinomonadaceae bacterium]
MTAIKRRRLEAAGWGVASAEEFLGLSSEEEAAVELKLRARGRGTKVVHIMTKIDKNRIVRSAVGSARLEGYKGSPKVKTVAKKDAKKNKKETKTASRR